MKRKILSALLAAALFVGMAIPTFAVDPGPVTVEYSDTLGGIIKPASAVTGTGSVADPFVFNLQTDVASDDITEDQLNKLLAQTPGKDSTTFSAYADLKLTLNGDAYNGVRYMECSSANNGKPLEPIKTITESARDLNGTKSFSVWPYAGKVNYKTENGWETKADLMTESKSIRDQLAGALGRGPDNQITAADYGTAFKFVPSYSDSYVTWVFTFFDTDKNYIEAASPIYVKLNHTNNVKIETLSIVKNQQSIAPGETLQYSGTFTPNALYHELQWFSSDGNVATIDKKTGLVTAVAPGETTITLSTRENRNAETSCVLAVQYAMNKDMENGDFTYTPEYPKSGDTVTVTLNPAENFQYTEGSFRVTPDSQGELTSQSIGNNRFTFIMPSEGVTVSAAFERIPATVDSVTVASPTADTVAKPGDEINCTASVSGTYNPAQTVNWSVEAEAGTTLATGTKIAQDGKLTIAADQADGKLKITATSTVDSDKSGSVIITVKDEPVTHTVTFDENCGVAFSDKQGLTNDKVVNGNGFSFKATPSDQSKEIENVYAVRSDTQISSVEGKDIIAPDSNGVYKVDNVTTNVWVTAKLKDGKAPEPVQHTVTFMSDGKEYKSVTVNEQATVKEPAAPTKDGYNFEGWFTAKNVKFDFNTPITESITLTAKWTEIGGDPDPVQYTVTFMSDGKVYKSVTVDENKAVSKPADPTKDSYTFDGWFTDEALTKKFNFSTTVDKNITLYAKWTKNTTPPPADVKVTGVKLDRSTATLTIGDALVLQATVSPDNATDKSVTWKSSDEAVATVSNGAVIAVGKGNAVITVTTKDGGFTAECVVTVEPKKVEIPVEEPNTGNDTADKAINDLNKVLEENQDAINNKIENGQDLDPANEDEKKIIETITENAQTIVSTNISTENIDPVLLKNMDAMVQVLAEVETEYALAIDESLSPEQQIHSVTPAGLGLNAIAESAKTGKSVRLILTVEALAPTEDTKDGDALLVFDMQLQRQVGDEDIPTSIQPLKPILFTVEVPAALKSKISWINIFTDSNAYRNSVQPSWSGTTMMFPMAHFSKAIPSTSKYTPTNNTTYSGGGSTGFSAYWITAEAGPNGSISPAGETKVEFGDSLTVTVTPDAGYAVDKVLIDGTKEVTLTDGKYTFENVNEPYTIKATFKKASGTAETPAPETKPETPAAVNPPTGDSWFAHLFDGLFC